MNQASTKLSLSDSNLATAEKLQRNSGFPPGITVDELFHYRKKKPPDYLQIHDNLTLEEGSFRTIKSEYKRRFRGDAYQQNQETPRLKAKKPEDSLKTEGLLELNPEYYETFIEYPIERTIARRPKDLINGLCMDVTDDEENTDDEQDSKHLHQFYKHSLFRRPTNLKLEGEFYSQTENAEKFIEYLLNDRPELIRKSTNLKLEGDMDTKTENKDKYVPFEYQSRPPLFKKSTNLHLEGILDISTEMREKYTPFETQPRPPFTKRGTNLHLEGDLKLQPEYRDAFVEYKETERPRPKLPVNNLRTEGNFDAQTEKSEKFVEHQIHPVIPFLRGSKTNRKFILGDDPIVKKAEYKEKYVEYPITERQFQRKPQGNLKQEGDMEVITENKRQFIEKSASKTIIKKANNNLLLEGNIDMNPEYRNAYVNFYRDAYGKFGIKKDDNEPEKRRRTTTHLKTEGKMETNPEYKSSFVNFPRQRPSIKKPESHLRSEGKLSHVTEKRAQYVEHPKTTKARPLKRQTELKLEGPLECQPEYRKAYIDYITRENVAERQPRTIENMGVPPARIFAIPDDQPVAENVEKEANAVSPSQPDESAAALTEPKNTLEVPVTIESKPRRKSSRRHVSLSPTPRTSGIKADKENISKMETSLFGPKVPNPSNRNKHASLKTEAEKRINEANVRARIARARRRFGSPVMVENLAYTPRISPVPAILEASNRWKREERPKKDHAFVVLTKVEAECSTDGESFKQCDKNRLEYKQLYKEQKWMPSWYASSSK